MPGIQAQIKSCHEPAESVSAANVYGKLRHNAARIEVINRGISIMKYGLLLSLLLIFSTAASAATSPVAGKQSAVSESALIDFLVADKKQAPDASKRREILKREFSTQNIILDEVNKLGLASTDAVKAQQELARRQILLGAYWADFFRKNPISQAKLQANYDKTKSAAGTRQYHVSQLLVRDETAANKVINSLKQNNSLADVAKEFSVKGGTRPRTDIGWVWRTSLVPPVAQAIDSLKPGEYSAQPIQLRSGFAIIKLEEVRDREFPSYDATKPQLVKEEQLRMQVEELKRLQSLRK